MTVTTAEHWNDKPPTQTSNDSKNDLLNMNRG
jgi:hypothetical protein